MKFVKISLPEPVEDYLAQHITVKLAGGQSVFWLIPGGSAMKIAAAAIKKIRAPLSRLSISLTDERYGPPGHSESNWRQLKEAGFEALGSNTLAVLDGSEMAKNADNYGAMLLGEIKKADYSLALAGLGTDGHILGIKPGSRAAEDRAYVIGYQADDYPRLTPTVKLLKLLDEVVIYAAGKEKWPQFDTLAKNISPAVQPAQLLKQLKNVIIFNDYKEGSL